jgi:DNA repair exonuclease SbcCD ATPase subunit
MVDLKLKRVSIRNWMKFRTIEIEFPEKGLVLVQGVNTASGGALLSVGSGKTGIGEAISRTLLGVPGRFNTLKQFSTDKSGNLYVVLETELHGKSLIVESGYKCKELSSTGEALRYHYDGKTIERGKIDQTRAELSKLLGVSPLLASWTAFIDGDSIKFNRLAQADSVELVMASLRQPPWSDYHEASKATLGKFRRDMAVNEAAHKSAAAHVEGVREEVTAAKRTADSQRQKFEQATAQNDAEIRRYQKAVNTKTQRIDEAKKEMEGIAKKLKIMEDERAEASHKLEIKLHEIEDALREAEEARKPLTESYSAAQEKVVEARTAYNNYASAAKNCPTCNRPMGKIDPARLQELKDALEAAKGVSQKSGEKWQIAEQRVVDLNQSYRDTSRKHREMSGKQDVEDMAERHEELEQAVSNTLDEIHEYELEIARLQNGPSDADLRAAEATLSDRQKALKGAQAALEEAAAALVGDQATLKVLEYWNLAFSPYGIPNMVLRDAIAPLNKEARRVSAAMTGGTIEVRYSTTRELASGLEKAQLNIEVDNKLGDKDLSGSSKGEAGLTNFIIAETLSEVGQVSRRVGYRWYDEIVPHQDPKVCHSIYSYMKETAHRLGILVFLVDHNPVAANYADHVLIVEKKGDDGKVTGTVRWR